MSEKPYTQKDISPGFFQRTFDKNVDDGELQWHRDKKNRYIKILSGEGWYLQMDDEMPQLLCVNSTYYVPKETYHRVLKNRDCTNLVIFIKETD